MRFIDDVELFHRQHSAAWATDEGQLLVLPPNHGHAAIDVDWNIMARKLGLTADEAQEEADRRSVSLAQIFMERAHWIAITSPFMGATEHPVSYRTWEAVAFYLASAAIWFARQGMDLLNSNFNLYSSTDPVFGRPGVVMTVGDVIARYAAPSVESEMYEMLSKLPTPKKPARMETPEERKKRYGHRY